MPALSGFKNYMQGQSRMVIFMIAMVNLERLIQFSEILRFLLNQNTTRFREI
jgi:hypothetical protein